MAFQKCSPGDVNAYGYVWIDSIQHEITEPDSVELRILHAVLVDKGSGFFSLDRSASAMLKCKFRKLLGIDRKEYESIRCSTIQYQTKDFLYTGQHCFFVLDTESPGDGETIEGTFIPGAGGQGWSSISVL
jgi:hypothetical protein